MAPYSKKPRTKKPTYSRKSRKVITVKDVKKIVSKAIIKKAEPKQFNQANATVQLYHNTLLAYTLNSIVCMPSQGTGDNSRIGDQIHVGGFYIRMLCANKQDRPNVTWKFYILRTPKASAVTYARLFDNVMSNVLIDNPNKDNCQVLYSKTIKTAERLSYFQGNTTNEIKRENSFPVKIWLPYKKLYKFQTDNSTTHNDHDIHLIVFAYDTIGTLETDNIASMQITHTMYYKDL